MFYRLTFTFLLFVLFTGKTLANGWEHTAIPFSALVTALSDKNAETRLKAAESMSFRNETEIADVLMQHLQAREENPRIRRAAYKALGKTANLKALPVIETCLEEEQDVAARSECAGALGEFANDHAETLAIASLGDDSAAVRVAAVRSLGAYSTAQSINTLSSLLADSNPTLVLYAIRSIGRTGAPQAGAILLDILESSTNRKHIIETLKALSILGDSQTAQSIKNIYDQNDDAEIRQYALIAMASTRAEESAPYFLDSLRDENPATRNLALFVIRESNDYSLVPQVVQSALKDSDFLFSASSEKLMDDPDKSIVYLSLLNESLKTIIALSPDQGFALYKLSARNKEIRRQNPLELKLAEGFYQARWQSLYGLGYTKNNAAGPILIKALSDTDSRIRAVAVRSLGVLEDNQYLEQIQNMLGDPVAEVRWTAARVLGRSKDSHSEAVLKKALLDSNSFVRLEATLSLGYLGSHSAVRDLEKVNLTDENNRVREAAAYAIYLISSQG